MKTYVYNGAVDHNSTIRVDGKLMDLRLTKGQPVSLPPDHPYVKALVLRGLLTEATTNAANTTNTTNTAK